MIASRRSITISRLKNSSSVRTWAPWSRIVLDVVPGGLAAPRRVLVERAHLHAPLERADVAVDRLLQDHGPAGSRRLGGEQLVSRRRRRRDSRNRLMLGSPRISVDRAPGRGRTPERLGQRAERVGPRR